MCFVWRASNNTTKCSTCQRVTYYNDAQCRFYVILIFNLSVQNSQFSLKKREFRKKSKIKFMTNFLEVVPPYILVAFFQDWISLREFAVLVDSAFCNKIQRDSLQYIMKVRKCSTDSFPRILILSELRMSTWESNVIVSVNCHSKLRLKATLEQFQKHEKQLRKITFYSFNLSIVEVKKQVCRTVLNGWITYFVQLESNKSKLFGLQFHEKKTFHHIYIGQLDCLTLQRSGFGTLYQFTGSMFIGYWLDGLRNGVGHSVMSDGKVSSDVCWEMGVVKHDVDE
jgi:hypothetical protein